MLGSVLVRGQHAAGQVNRIVLLPGSFTYTSRSDPPEVAENAHDRVPKTAQGFSNAQAVSRSQAIMHDAKWLTFSSSPVRTESRNKPPAPKRLKFAITEGMKKDIPADYSMSRLTQWLIGRKPVQGSGSKETGTVQNLSSSQIASRATVADQNGHVLK
ncbi:MAG: hypothetical protein Q9202_006062 [Teloschistes flavicans]